MRVFGLGGRGRHPHRSATMAMEQTSATLAFAEYLRDAPAPPRFATPEHHTMIAGKDAVLGMALCGLHAERTGGSLQHLTADDMIKFSIVLMQLDEALSRHLGVDMRGNALQ